MTLAYVENGQVIQVLRGALLERPGWTVVPDSICVGMIDDGQGGFVLPPKTVDEAKLAKIAEINAAFVLASEQPIADPLGGPHFYAGGYESGQRLDGARRLAEKGGRPSIVIHDTDYNPHTVTVAECLQIALAVGSKYEADYARLKDRLRALRQATTQAEIDAITW